MSNFRDRLLEHLRKIETSDDDVHKDLMVFLLAYLPDDPVPGMSVDRHSVREWLKDCPIMLTLLKEMKNAKDNRALILLGWHEYQDREDDLGYACKMLIRMCS
jgi:hypothetical protein